MWCNKCARQRNRLRRNLFVNSRQKNEWQRPFVTATDRVRFCCVCSPGCSLRWAAAILRWIPVQLWQIFECIGQPRQSLSTSTCSNKEMNIRVSSTSKNLLNVKSSSIPSFNRPTTTPTTEADSGTQDLNQPQADTYEQKPKCDRRSGEH